MVSASRRVAMSRKTPPCGLPRPAFTSALIARATSSRGAARRAAVVLLVGVPAVRLGLGVRRLLLEELGDVIEHEAPPVEFRSTPPSPRTPLGDQDPAHAVRPDHPGGVELVALHVDEVRPGLQAIATPSPVYSQELEVNSHALPMPPVASTTALALKTTNFPDSRQ
jgi:hypothetical protein